MCLIIHKPAGETVPEWLVESALMYNPDGFGIMGAAGVTRRVRVSLDEAMSTVDARRGEECAIHFRYRTAGDKGKANVHPHKLGRAYAMHNGTLSEYAGDKRRSDTRLFLDQWLAPRMRRGNMPARSEVESKLGHGNKLVLMPRPGQFTVYNRHLGLDHGALWLSNDYAWDYPAWMLPDAEKQSADAGMRALVEANVLAAFACSRGYDGLDFARPYAGTEEDWNFFYDLVDSQISDEDYVSLISDEALLDIMQHIKEY
jgi:hypothetical protein